MTRPRPTAASFRIRAGQVFDGTMLRGPASVHIVEGVIAEVGPAEASGDEPGDVRLPADAVLAPGFIDTQVNGGGGVLLNDDPSPAAIARIAAAHRRFGTTGLLPTLITDEPERLRALAETAPAAMAVPGVLGFHLEGPFLNPARKGIHPEAWIRVPSEAEIALLLRFAGYGRSLVTVAPECLPPGTIARLAAGGLVVAVGHSDATAPAIAAAAAEGLRGATHLFNAMSQIAPRAPGVAGAVLGSDSLFAGIICDGVHVDPLNLQIARRVMGPDRLMLVTDAMALVGSDRTSFALQGRRIRLAGDRLTDAAGTLAGAHLTMIEAVWKAVRLMRVPLEEALAMASRTPAAFLGLGETHGRIAPGFAADLVAFRGPDVLATWIGGRSA